MNSAKVIAPPAAAIASRISATSSGSPETAARSESNSHHRMASTEWLPPRTAPSGLRDELRLDQLADDVGEEDVGLLHSGRVRRRRAEVEVDDRRELAARLAGEADG